MAIRFVAASGLALAAALFVAAPARAQGFFGFYEMSPRQIVGMLEDDGYRLRGPMIRRGEVYVCDVTSLTGRSARLIVSARDGQVIERYAAAPRWRDFDADEDPRARRDFGDDADRSPDSRRNRDVALGDLVSPPSRVYGGDALSSPLTPPALIPDANSLRPKPHAAKKHKDPALVKAPAAPEAPKPAEAGSSVAAIAPNAAPEPKKPAVEPVKPAEASKPAAEVKPAPAPTPAQTKAEAEKRPDPAPAKPEPHTKKINDLPVGTLD